MGTKSVLSDRHFHDEAAAYRFVEKRVWPDGPVRCGGVDRIGKMKGSSTRVGAYKCYQCRKPFTVKVGTVQPCTAASVASGDLPAGFQQEGDQL